jgi:hypothetical protein
VRKISGNIGNSLLRFEIKNSFFYYEERSSLLQQQVCKISGSIDPKTSGANPPTSSCNASVENFTTPRVDYCVLK